jgi:hypothetical protein
VDRYCEHYRHYISAKDNQNSSALTIPWTPDFFFFSFQGGFFGFFLFMYDCVLHCNQKYPCSETNTTKGSQYLVWSLFTKSLAQESSVPNFNTLLEFSH